MNAPDGPAHPSAEAQAYPASLPVVTLCAPLTRPHDDLELLLRSRGIGPLVVQRLTEVGVYSIFDLMRRGVEPTVQAICSRTGQPSWMNRTDALVQALADALRAPLIPKSGPSR